MNAPLFAGRHQMPALIDKPILSYDCNGSLMLNTHTHTHTNTEHFKRIDTYNYTMICLIITRRTGVQKQRKTRRCLIKVCITSLNASNNLRCRVPIDLHVKLVKGRKLPSYATEAIINNTVVNSPCCTPNLVESDSSWSSRSGF